MSPSGATWGVYASAWAAAALAAGTALWSYVAGRWLLPPVLALLREGGMIRKNYLGRQLPVGAGVVVPLASLGPWLLLVALGRGVRDEASPVFLWIALLFGMSFLGLLDDAAGDRRRTGFSGHVRALVEGKPTTGSLKALFGGLLALSAGLSLHGLSVAALVSGAVVALSANAVNLLDVRPGRALKGTALLSAAAAVANLAHGWPHAPGSVWPVHHWAAWSASMGAALALWRGDHKGEWMLGDAGANAVGAAAGLLAAAAPLAWQGALLAVLVAVHLYSEKRSLSRLIEASPLLDRLDRWGR